MTVSPTPQLLQRAILQLGILPLLRTGLCPPRKSGEALSSDVMVLGVGPLGGHRG